MSALSPENELRDAVDRLVKLETGHAFSLGRWAVDEQIGEQKYRERLRGEINEAWGAVDHWITAVSS